MQYFQELAMKRELARKVRDIHGFKTKHSIKDLEHVIEAYKESLDKAIESNLLFPSINNAYEIYNAMVNMRERIIRTECNIKTTSKDPRSRDYAYIDFKINLYDSVFKFYFMGSQLARVAGIVDKNIILFGAKSMFLKNMKQHLMNTIELEVLPNDLDGERTYFGQGKLIMLTTVESKGYHVFDISMKACSQCNKPHLEFITLTRYGLRSIEEAIEKYVDPAVIGTVAIARNTESYSLAETVIPIIGEKYVSGLGWKGAQYLNSSKSLELHKDS